MEQLTRIAAYLQQYAQTADNSPILPPDPAILSDAIKLLLENEIMTVEEIRHEALEEFSVIVPWVLFPENVRREMLGSETEG